MSELSKRVCEPCRGGALPLKGSGITELLTQLDSGWEVVDEHHLSRAYGFSNFAKALAFVNAIGELAEAAGHHPDLTLKWGHVGVEIHTH
ncbi:MAG: 4a-hydroxytetrahydrobiopterin dehydratase, partial [Myxococcota bacterium]